MSAIALRRDDLTDNLILINIDQNIPEDEKRPADPKALSAQEFYEVTRGAWRRRLDTVTDADYALAVYKEEVLEVYKIDTWQPAGTTAMQVRKGRIATRNRIEFVGKLADRSIREKYVGRSVKNLVKPGEADPLKVFLNDETRFLNEPLLLEIIACLPEYFLNRTGSGEIDFTKGLFANELYKRSIPQAARKVLEIDTWTEEMIGSGQIANRMRKAMNKANNLVNSMNQSRFRDALDPEGISQEDLERGERALYHLYCGPHCWETFQDVTDYFSAIYDVISFLYMIKDETRFVTNSSRNMDAHFARLGISLRTEGRLSYGNLNVYNRLLGRIRDLINQQLQPAVPATLLDAHSFIWISDDVLAWKQSEYDSGFYPALTEYDPEVSAEQYKEIFRRPDLISKNRLDTVFYLYQMGGQASCSQLSKKYGDAPSHYNLNATRTAKAVAEKTKCSVHKEKGIDRFWSVLFQGREGSRGEGFIWKLRRPLADAIADLDKEGFFAYLGGKKMYHKPHELNTILYGPPGTGKTYYTVIRSVAIIEDDSIENIEREAEVSYSQVKERYDRYVAEGRIAFTTFHQSYGYEEFIQGIKPAMSEEEAEGDLAYRIQDGVFKAFCERAALQVNRSGDDRGMERDSDITPEIRETIDPPADQREKNYVFIIDEINRGNISKIFGELITLIEPAKRLGNEEAMTVQLPYSPKEPFGVPKNVYLIGTMNTADRSIASMDTALRRRFSFVEMMPDSDVLRNNHADRVSSDGVTLDVAAMLDIINQRIEALYDREHMIGHAFFLELAKHPSKEVLASIFRNKVIPLLQEYFFEDYGRIQLVLGDDGKRSEDKRQFQFIRDSKTVARDLFYTVPREELPVKYSIQEEAFDRMESYKLIWKGL